MQHTHAHLFIYCIGVVWPIHCELNLTRSFMLDTNVYTMCNLYMGFTQLMTESFISEFPCVERYFWTMVNQPNFKKVLGEVKQISLSFLLQRSKYLSQKNLQYQSLRMNPKRRNQHSPNQNLVRKRRKSKGNVAIHNVDCCQHQCLRLYIWCYLLILSIFVDWAHIVTLLIIIIRLNFFSLVYLFIYF